MITRNEAPVGRVHPEQRALLRRLLVGLLALLGVATLISVLMEGRRALTPGELAMNVVLAAAIVAGLWLLRRGHVESVVWLVGAALLLVGVDGLGSGLADNEAVLLVFVAPVTLVGLLLGRGALFLMAAITVAIVVAAYALETYGSSLIRPAPETAPLYGAVVLFVIVIALLVLFLDRFALTLQNTLARSEAREAELRREVAERAKLEARLRLTTDAAHVGLWSWDTDSNEVEWSARMKELMGVPAQAPVTLDSFLQRVHPDDRERMSRSMAELESDVAEPYRVLLPDGGVRWLVGRGETVAQPDGRRVMLGAVFDVTQLKEAEAEREALLVREREARSVAELASEQLSFLAEAGSLLAESLDYRETLSRVADLVVPRVADWCAVDVLNDQGELERVVVHHSDPEKVGFAHELHELYPADPNAPQGSYRVLKSGEPALYPRLGRELLEAVAQDRRHLQMLQEVGFSSAIIAPLISRGRPLGVLILVQAESGRSYDAEDLRLATQLAERAALAVDNSRLYSRAQELNAELEERVRLRTEELEKANAELESFTYSASHDLRAPLRGINGFSKALLDDYGPQLDDVARGYLERISSAAVRMGELIDDLLSLSRLANAPLERRAVDLSALSREVIAGLEAGDRERIPEVSIADGLEAQGDERFLRIALENLLGNAWKFTGDAEEPRIEVGFDEAQDAFYVRDNGAGFDMAYANKLFMPFQRLHRTEDYQGSGIGLATTKRVIERLGGTIWAEAEPGRGATFYFRLPVEGAGSEMAD